MQGESYGEVTRGAQEELWVWILSIHLFMNCADQSRYASLLSIERKCHSPQALAQQMGRTPVISRARIVRSHSSTLSSTTSLNRGTRSSSSTSELSGQARIKRLWEEFISDPAQNRFDKKYLKYTESKHKTSKDALWIDNRFSPPWAQPKLATTIQDGEQEQSFSTCELSGQAARTEQLWQEFFSDPSQWWDDRSNKKNPKCPDFRHKITNDELWIEGWWNPPWVKAMTSTIAQGHVQSGGGLRSQYGSSAGVDCEGPGWEYNRKVSKLCEEGQLKKALQIVDLMIQQGIGVSIKTYACLLQVCIRMKTMAEGKGVHDHIIRSGFESNIYLGNTLVDMYAKCGSLLDARQVFDTMPEHNIFSWTAIIVAYAKQGQSEESVNLFQQMQQASVAPDKVLYIVILKACASLVNLELGKQVHDHIITGGFESDVVVGSALVDMYAKCRSIKDARHVFSKIRERDLISWTTMITGYAQQGHGEEAFGLFEQMQREGFKPDKITFISILKACTSLAALERGKQVHADIIKSGFELDVFVASSLIDMYVKCGSIEDAHRMFSQMHERDVVLWTVMIAGYVHQGHGEEAFILFEQMQLAGVKPDKVTFVSIVKACASLATVERGKQVHAQIINSGFELDAFVGSTLVDMYAKCGCIEDAREVFNKMCERDVVAWTAMIAGYAQQGYDEEALTMFEQMQQDGVKPNNVTFVSILKACASLAALEQSKHVHAHIIESGFESDVTVENTLIDAYANCGSIEDARQVFNKMCGRSVVSWNVMIAGYARQGDGEEALTLFEQMQREGLRPNEVTFVCVLSACSHAGLVDEGCQQFYSMSQDFGITPMIEHYVCMVDLLGRARCLEEAEDFIKKLPIQPNAVLWMALLSTCRCLGNVEVGRHAFECIIKLEPNCAGAYVLLSHIYASADRWDEVANIRKEMEATGVKKEPGGSWIEVNNQVHAFSVGERAHPQSKEIQAELKRLIAVMKGVGYVPDLSFMLHNIGDEQKENVVCNHSEKLAIVFGLICTLPMTPIRFKKNLRVCDDCHNATKIISMIVGREIIARYANQFHHFKDGVCSCGDYW